jgi:putative peptidoglycan lipid II flippase
VRVTITTVLGYLFALPLPRLLGIDASWGAAGLTASAGMAGWVEMLLLRSRLRRRVGECGMPASYLASLWGAAIVAAGVAWAVKLVLPPVHPVVQGAAVLGPYGVAYFGATLLLQIPEASDAVRRVLRRGR